MKQVEEKKSSKYLPRTQNNEVGHDWRSSDRKAVSYLDMRQKCINFEYQSKMLIASNNKCKYNKSMYQTLSVHIVRGQIKKLVIKLQKNQPFKFE